MEHLDPDSFMITLNFVATFAEQIANAPVNPIPRKLADTVVEKIEQAKKMRAAAEQKEADKKESEDKKDASEDKSAPVEEKK